MASDERESIIFINSKKNYDVSIDNGYFGNALERVIE